ncbi:DUF47 family protein [bacterium]|nr:DUF47 family protein [candidate division CSSED10-310 bacterium]
MFTDKKAREVENLLSAHIVKIGEVITEAHKMILDYMTADKVFKQESYQVHALEQEADSIRNQIGEQLYDGAFLPVYRMDYFDIVDRLDRIANHAELFSDFIYLTRPMIPSYLVDQMKEMLSLNTQAYQALAAFVESFLGGQEDFLAKKVAVHQFESDIDRVQFRGTRIIFKSDLRKIDKFHLKGVIDKFARISDLMEDAADRILVFAAKLRM